MRKYVKPELANLSIQSKSWFPAATFVGSVVGAVVGNAVFGDDINRAGKPQDKLERIEK